MKYLDNAFWEDGTEDRSKLKCIRTGTRDNKRVNDVMLFHKNLGNGSLCEDYRAVVAQLGVEKIDANTAERRQGKDKKERERKSNHEQQKKTQELEILFGLKLRAFENETIKNSDDRALRTKIRRSQNDVELNAYATILMMKELGYIKNDGTD